MQQEEVLVPYDVIDTILYGHNDSQKEAGFIFQTDWVAGGKHESQSTYFMWNGKYLRYDERRSGSPFSDYHYEDDYEDEDFRPCVVVAPSEVMLHLIQIEHVIKLLKLADKNIEVYECLPKLP